MGAENKQTRSRLVARSAWSALCDARVTVRSQPDNIRVRDAALDELSARLSGMISEPLRILIAGADAMLDDHVLASDCKHDQFLAGLSRLGIQGLEFCPDPSASALGKFLAELTADNAADSLETDLVARLRGVGGDTPAIRILLESDLEGWERMCLATRASRRDTPDDATANPTSELTREATANLPVLVAGQILDDVGQHLLPSAAATPWLLDLMQEMLRRDDIAGVAWLVDWASSTRSLGAGGLNALRYTLEEQLTPFWFDRFLSRAAGRQIEALGALLLHVGERVLESCLAASHLPGHPEAHHIARTIAAVDTGLLEETFRQGEDPTAELALRALVDAGAPPPIEAIAIRLDRAGDRLRAFVDDLGILGPD